MVYEELVKTNAYFSFFALICSFIRTIWWYRVLYFKKMHLNTTYCGHLLSLVFYSNTTLYYTYIILGIDVIRFFILPF